MSTSTERKQKPAVSDPPRPQNQKLLPPGYNISMLDMVKEIQDSNITKNQKTMKNDQANKKMYQRAFRNEIRNSVY